MNFTTLAVLRDAWIARNKDKRCAYCEHPLSMSDSKPAKVFAAATVLYVHQECEPEFEADRVALYERFDEMSTYTRIGTEIGELVDQKNAAYGSSFAKAGDFLRLLWPDGIAPERYTDALLLVRIFDKQMRIATDRDAFGESPYRDIAGYGLLGAALHEERGMCAEERSAPGLPDWHERLSVWESRQNRSDCVSCGKSLLGERTFVSNVLGKVRHVHAICGDAFRSSLVEMGVVPFGGSRIL